MGLTDLLTAIADSIRIKTGTEGLINAQDMPQRILGIPSGGDMPLSIQTGTFSFEEDTTGPVTLTFNGKVIVFMYFADEIVDKDEYIKLSMVGAEFMVRTPTNWRSSFYISGSNVLSATTAAYDTGYYMTVDDNVVTFTSSRSTYLFRAGYTYRYFAWVEG